MKRSDLLAPLVLVLAVAPVAAENGFESLDEVDGGHTESLDSKDGGHTDSLDSADRGRTESFDSKDDGHTDSLDSADRGHTESLDSADRGHTYGLDQAERGTLPERPQPVPEAEFASRLPGLWERRLSLAHREVVRAGERYHEADDAYTTLRITHFPTGDARVEIEREYAAAERALKDANARYLELVQRARQAAEQPPAAAPGP